ncbi:uncharacterized protein MELLADRAFT_60017 [Melampsora larici-populina 98AG31]|uniref:DUF6589 domain-containing protein n=1 Tax=Melampsora larici-populina (strain 98AG31 / pathotype 3-4-7) TaxID=747676 RepID=F4R9N6_MELLP|nr:uncharacterized protein MELLADRAFT_60017 [Melampsora larici-populina 98AG31]EGG11117.1 hypothetical protein MELLADRAFT_60017 [Melampsora larici-populina 98AG31]
MFQRTWCSYIVVCACLLANCEAEVVNLAAFLTAMKAAKQKGPGETKHFKKVIKAQLANALKEDLDHLPIAPKKQNLLDINLIPPLINPSEFHTPNIHFLRMIDVPDSLAKGVSHVFNLILSQIYLSKEEYVKHILVAGGDVGSNLLVESLCGKLSPSIDRVEDLSGVLSICGVVHTTWSFGKGIWALHGGNSDNSKDSAVWCSSFELGGDYTKSFASQEFNFIMRSMQIVHKANLVCSLVIESLGDMDMTTTWGCRQVLETVWCCYFKAMAIEEARCLKKSKLYNLMICLRDFGTIVDLHETTCAGDIGCLTAMWKCWSIMTQGVTSLSHYGQHIPCMVFLLEEDLLVPLAHVIKHSSLIPSTDRDNHWMPIDEYQEIHIFYLKQVYDSTVSRVGHIVL